ncbi:MAG: substrate-binding domain-containing protein [Rhodospirillum sp.]|nr:substrate-binding domain-containing protein [Rhodospirillum sp.]MCF8490601.1 substrate-binding domain-containing protein [Rhodospirillum sp.]MCF8498952.1 substrate-binding domain-containing protein [Rhodospirillum sp.]
MTRCLRVSALLLALTFLVTGSSARAEGPVRDRALIVGSSSIFPLATAVAERVSRMSDLKAPMVEATGTGGGFQRFCAGIGLETPDVVTASRPITEEERTLCAKNEVTDIQEVFLGRGAIVLARSWNTNFGDLTRRELWLALADRIPRDWTAVANPNTLWSDVAPHLPALPIKVYGPPPTSGTRDVLGEVVMEPGCLSYPMARDLPPDDQAELCRHFREDSAYVEAGEDDEMIVRRLVNDQKALGFIGYSTLARNEHLLSPVPLEGIPPTPETIATGSYPLTRSLYLYIKTAHLPLVPGMAPFIDHFTSEEAIGPEGYLTFLGLIPADW